MISPDEFLFQVVHICLKISENIHSNLPDILTVMTDNLSI